LLFLVDAARRASARSVTAVLPYFPYGKGDKKDEPRVSIRGRVVADVLEAVGVDRVLTMDLHSAQIQGFFHVPVDNLYALPIFADAAEELIAAGAIAHPVFVAPDIGATRLAREYWRQLARHGADVAVGDKIRPSLDEKSEVTSLLGDVSGRDTILVDDVIFTGGTLCNMAEKLAAEGARSVRAFATHGLLTGDAVERFLKSPIAELLVTDTVPIDEGKAAAFGSRLRQVSAAPLFAAAIQSIYEQTSIGRLFG
jgi:ribose-phosphate pyrophosphokinase